MKPKYTFRAALAALMLAAVLLPLTVIPASAASTNASIYQYETSSSGLTLTGYDGSFNAVAIPDAIGGRPVTALGDGLFSGHTEIKRVRFGTNLTSIGKNAFRGCTSLTAADLPDSLRTIGDSAFSGCTALAGVDLGDGLTTLESSAFSGCTSLCDIVLPSTVTKLGDSVFRGCSSLRSVTLCGGASASFGKDSFGEPSDRLTVFAPAASPVHKLSDGYKTAAADGVSALALRESGGNIIISGYTGSAAALVIPSQINGKTVTGIDIHALSADKSPDCAGLRVIILPRTVGTIGERAFADDTSLEYVRMPDSMSGNIESDCFSGCSALRSVIVPEGVYSVGSGAFAGCSALTSATLPSTLGKIMSGGFYRCSSLASLTLWGGMPACPNKNGVETAVAFGGVSEKIQVYADALAGWKTDAEWSPNGTPSFGYAAFPVTVTKYDCFFIETVRRYASCSADGLSVFSCPFCGEYYETTTPKTEHSFVSLGTHDGVEAFRCTACTENYTVNHLNFAVISAVIDTAPTAEGKVSSVTVTFRDLELTEGTDYKLSNAFIENYKRVELTVTGIGDYSDEVTVAYSTVTGGRLTPYTLTVSGGSGSGVYYKNDVVSMIPDAEPPSGYRTVWSVEGASLTASGDNGAAFVMPGRDVSVSVGFEAIETTPPDTEPPEPVTDEVTTPPVTEPVTTPPDTGEETTLPYLKTPEGRRYMRRAMIWGGVLFLSLAAGVAVCIFMFRKENKKK